MYLQAWVAVAVAVAAAVVVVQISAFSSQRPPRSSVVLRTGTWSLHTYKDRLQARYVSSPA